jgi:hypothetical protein
MAKQGTPWDPSAPIRRFASEAHWDFFAAPFTGHMTFNAIARSG